EAASVPEPADAADAAGAAEAEQMAEVAAGAQADAAAEAQQPAEPAPGAQADETVVAEAADAAGANTGAYGAAPWEQPAPNAESDTPDTAPGGGGWTPFELDRDVAPAADAPEPAAAPLPGLQDVTGED